ncbi:MAG: hypothetical protein ASUL_08799 [Candidatus Aramenus sulfurataquae]|jgi:nucleoside-diphosphate-sugar epimerase|uniref:NAD-dependent epimerase/dehydratase family protein n=3 Tax=Candidatus Aramenus sulfurataquae TaxID=1326980 RepID=W7KVH0_9CREN|nr:MAG: hypothetical protein ASUL_08799 [Candidatus Aramenus sulfurataquae]MCL7344607.1 NAD-dependent epimerase/dehydratase family protein [Candidatus Aramenus sulfurataquae]
MKYLILGLGFVATHVAEYLSSYGEVVVTYRHLNPVKEVYANALKEKGVKLVKVDPLEENISGLVKDADAVINLVGEISGDEETLRRANVEVPTKVAKTVAKENPRAVMVHLSGMLGMTGNVRPEEKHCEGVAPTTTFERTKCEGEKAIREAGVNAAILRPGLIYGKYGAHVQFVTMYKFAKRGFVPAIGFLFSSISANSVARIIRAVVEERPKFTYFYATECEPVKVDKFFEAMARALRKRYVKIPIPKSLAKAYLPADIRNLLKYDGSRFDCSKAKSYDKSLEFDEREVEENAKFLKSLDERGILIPT